MKFIRWVPFWLIGLSSLAWAKEPGAGSQRPGAPPGKARASGSAAFARPSAVSSERYVPAPGTANAPPRTMWKTAVGELADRIQRSEIKKEDLPAKYAELRSTRTARRVARLESLKREVGADAFGRPEFQKELARHHRTIAYLERARLVAESDVEGMRKAKALMRISAMLYRENGRHEAALAVLRAALPSGSGAPAARAAPPGPSGAAPKASAP